jgi:hypothetical protein
MKRWMVMLAALAVYGGAASAQSLVLYDGSNSNPPQMQGSLEYTDALGISTSVTGSGETTLNTTASALDGAGYSNYTPGPTPAPALVNPGFPTLDPTLGFTLNFDLMIDSEAHGSSPDRAGFSVILLGSDGKGIELGFWTNEIWSQADSTFTSQGEEHNFDTTAFTQYSLTILNGNYTLLANGGQILTGATRDYSARGTPYNLDDYVFLGDDTSEADAKAEFTSINIVPEPGAGALGLGMMMLGLSVRSRRAGVEAV